METVVNVIVPILLLVAACGLLIVIAWQSVFPRYDRFRDHDENEKEDK